MKQRAAWCLAVSSLLLAPAWAASFSYSFDGELSDHFEPILPNQNSSLSQNDQLGQLEYATPKGRLHGENATGMAHTQFRPRFDQSWMAAVDVGLPLSYDASFLTDNPDNQNPTGDTWLEVGIAAIADAEADELFVVSLALEPDTSSGVRRILLATDESTGSDREANSDRDQARLQLGFDAITGQLSAFANGSLLFTTDLGPGGSNWEMTDEDVFQIVLFGSTGHQDVAPTEPLTHDNFVATIIPEPSVLLILCGLAGCVLRRN